MFPSNSGLRSAGLAVVVALGTLPGAAATLVVPVSGTSAAGNPVAFTATFMTSGDTLTLTLANTSRGPTTATADVLSSFYFDIFQSGTRPPLDFDAAMGAVYEVRRNDPDIFVPGGLPDGSTDLRAASPGDGTWQFRVMNPGLAPGLGFGIGTVGNSAYNPNSFAPSLVDQADFTIYSTGADEDIDPVGNLVGRRLVRGAACFRFTGLDPLQPVEIVDRFVFGLGTSPDSVVVAMPEPAAVALVATGLGGLLLYRLLKHRRPRNAPRPRPDVSAPS